METKKFLVLILWLLFVPLSVLGNESICVLSLFEEDSREEGLIADVFQYYEKAQIYYQADLDDIRHCFYSNDYEEILFVSHGAELPNGNSAPLKYDDKFPLLPIFFSIMAENLRAGFDHLKTKRVRIAICGINGEGKPTMSPLIEYLKEQSVEIDYSPEHQFATWLYDKSVTSLTREWLAESINSSELTRWATDKNGWCEDDDWNNCDRGQAKYAIPIE